MVTGTEPDMEMGELPNGHSMCTFMDIDIGPDLLRGG